MTLGFVVSIHAPVWGATQMVISNILLSTAFQSTRPCGARLGKASIVGDIAPVSIHAPVWGATVCSSGANQPHVVSIHAPVWGATSFLCSALLTNLCFNPRARVGRDERAGFDRPGNAGFNPRARVGRD